MQAAMEWRMLKHAYALAAVLLVLPIPGAALALEYCVTCEGPPAMYRCVIDDTEEGPGRDPGVSLHCISEMARRGGHQSCGVSRGAPFPCPGLTAVVEQPRNLPRLAAPSPENPASEAVSPPAAEIEQPDAPAAPEKPAKVPRTVEELAGETVRSSKQGLKKAGEAIGGTAKLAGEQIGNAGSAIGTAASKTWTCIASLFSTCGGDEPAAEAPPEDAAAN